MKTPHSLRSVRILVVLAISWLALGIGLAAPAQAEAATFAAGTTAWFWDSAEGLTTCTNDPAVGGCGDVSPSKGIYSNAAGSTPISHGHLGVGVKDGSSDMRAYVAFDIPFESGFFGAEVSSFVARFIATNPTDTEHFEQHQSRNMRPPGTINASSAVIHACLMRDSFGAAEGDPPAQTVIERPLIEEGENEPKIYTQQKEFTADLSMCVQGKVADDNKTWTFDITSIAKGWASGAYLNNGIGLIPGLGGPGANWTVEFHGAQLTEEVLNPVTGEAPKVTYVEKADAASAAAEFSPGAAPPPPPPPPPPPAVSFPSFGNAGPTFVPPPATEPPAPPLVGQVPTVPVSFFGETPWWFYVVLLVGLAATWIVSGSIVGTDPLTGASTSTVTSRVARVLRARRLDGGAAIDET